MSGRENAATNYGKTYFGTYYDGNAVRKTEIPSNNPNIRIKTGANVKKGPSKEQIARQKKARLRAKISAFGAVMLIVLAAFLVLYRGVLITEATNRIEMKEKELTDIIATNKRVEMEIEHALDLKTVESVAVERLGMSRPEKYQTVYVDLNQVDHVEKISGGDHFGASKLFAFFDKAKEYLD